MKRFLGLAATSLVALVAVGCTVTTSSSSGGSSGGTQSPDRASPAGGGACYADTRTGCQDVAWSDVERLIDAAYLGRTTYFGHAMMTESYVVDLPADAPFLAVALPDGTSLRADVP